MIKSSLATVLLIIFPWFCTTFYKWTIRLTFCGMWDAELSLAPNRSIQWLYH